MAAHGSEDIPEGWEMYMSQGANYALYINTQTKNGPWPKPSCPGGWTLVARNPVRQHALRAPEPSYSMQSTSILPDSVPSTSLHRALLARSHVYSGLPEEIQCSHILIKHMESRRPTSWRCESIRRTKQEALVIASDFREQIMSKESRFEDIAKVFSDCSSAKRLGDLGRFKRGQMQKAFETVAFKLKVGQMSRPVETKSGVHLILRTY